MRFLSAIGVLAMPYSGVWGAERSASLQVDYTAPALSVEAHHVSVQDVLVAVGDQVGFTVISIGPITAPVLHLSLQAASVEEVLDTLLGGRNYGVSYHPASAQAGHSIDKVFVLGAPESAGAVTSRVETMGDYYPRSTQPSPSSLTELRTRHQDIFTQLRKYGENLNEPDETNQKDPPDLDPNLVRQHQQEVEKARGVFDTLTQANQMQRVNGKTTPPSHLGRSTSELDKDLESFHDVLMEMTSQRQQ
jgi:hypothetical protein